MDEIGEGKKISEKVWYSDQDDGYVSVCTHEIHQAVH